MWGVRGRAGGPRVQTQVLWGSTRQRAAWKPDFEHVKIGLESGRLSAQTRAPVSVCTRHRRARVSPLPPRLPLSQEHLPDPCLARLCLGRRWKRGVPLLCSDRRARAALGTQTACAYVRPLDSRARVSLCRALPCRWVTGTRGCGS